MAKFSMFRDEDEEDDDEFSIRSPKRRRISEDSSSTVQSINDDADQINGVQRSENSKSGDDDDVVSADDEPEKSPVILSDTDLLDCFICFNPLTVPVFQCDSGHIVCSSCCTKLSNKCPSCCGKIGYNRCRAIEKVIESVRVSCGYLKHGCQEMVIYCKKHDHENTCIYAPCSCPFLNCKFRGSPRRLSRHISRDHTDCVVRFQYDSSFPVSVGMDEKIVVLQEERDGILFILSHGNTVTVRCIDPSLSKRRFAYNIALQKGDNSLNFQSLTHCTEGHVRNPPLEDYCLVPGYFYDTNSRLKLEVCIRSKELF